MASSTILHARVRPEAVDCPHQGQRCGLEQECEDRCGRILEETKYFLRGWGHGEGKPNPRTLSLALDNEPVHRNEGQLREARAQNGQPLFDVLNLDDIKREWGV